MKKPDIKMPGFLNDLYLDLKDRRLLPLVALLLVAIVAAPFVLKDSQPELTPTQGQTGIVADPQTSPAQLMVVANDAGLRRYQRRLNDLKAKDPFSKHFKAPDLKVSATELTTPDATTTTSTTTVTPDSTSTTTVTDTADPPFYQPPVGYDPDADAGNEADNDQPDDPPAVQVETKYVSYEINAKVGKPGDTHLRKGIPELTMLPNEKHPVALFMGVTDDAKKALFLVSNDVTSVFGDVGCGFGDETCQLLELEPGFPVQFTLEGDKNRYQISVTKIVKVITERDKIAPKTTEPGTRALSGVTPAG